MKRKRIIQSVLMWIDNNINHKFIDKFFDLFPDSDFAHWLWRHTSRAFCCWVTGFDDTQKSE
jgi:hypothetical protein